MKKKNATKKLIGPVTIDKIQMNGIMGTKTTVTETIVQFPIHLN